MIDNFFYTYLGPVTSFIFVCCLIIFGTMGIAVWASKEGNTYD